MTPDQIRLIRRLTPNITVLFDGDAAGIRASIRGIDLILEQGMNVKVLIFPDGEDPDTFAKNKTTEELKSYLDENSKDFISFKVSLLLEDAQNDPIKKAGLIRDIVTSISKIPDNIKREVYVQECARVMEISEKVLFNELAQIRKKSERDSYQKAQQQQKQEQRKQQTLTKDKGAAPASSQQAEDDAYFEMMIAQAQASEQGAAPPVQKSPGVNTLEIFERQIIMILLIYGNKQVDFVDWLEEADEFGQIKMVKDEYSTIVSQELYLQLQDDEIEFTNEVFQKIYLEIITKLNLEEQISIEELTSHRDPDISQTVTDILMDDEKHVLSDWEGQEINVTPKDEVLPKLVTDAILNLRRVLIERKIEDLKSGLNDVNKRENTLESVLDYTQLRTKLFEKLNRIL